MLHTLHYDVAHYEPGCKRHPGILKDHCAFAPLTPLGLETLKTALAGKWEGGILYVLHDDDVEAMMDKLEDIEVHLWS